MSEDIDDKIEEAAEDKNVIKGEAGKELADLLGDAADAGVNEEPSEGPELKVPKPKDITDDIKDKVYDVKLPTGFEGEVAGVRGDIDITASDKELYLKALLNDESVVLEIPFCDGGIVYKIRSKTSWEQTLAYEATVTSKIEDTPEELDYYQSMLKLQKMGATLQILSINGKSFSNLKFEKAGDDWTDQIFKLRKACTETIETMESTKLTLTLNALRIFEYKIAKMSSECNSGDFWKPAG
tara:strand:- start:10752 stop:11471 length:720 start_codon:yes stop_codon:yes gene_type:complete